MSAFAAYTDAAKDGYPPEWHATIKDAVREAAGHRCTRCGHPYRKGEHGDGEFSPCDEGCSHTGPFAVRLSRGIVTTFNDTKIVTREVLEEGIKYMREALREPETQVLACWRILTVHHLDGDKLNCRWWNLVALCQRCHLTIQGRVFMARVWPWEHSDWFKPYVAGYYAHVYLGEDLTRDEVDERLDELLALELGAPDCGTLASPTEEATNERA